MEEEVHKQFSTYLDENKLISDFEFGFRKNKSTELAATKLLEEVRWSVDSGCIFGVCILHLSKAFDTINHPKLVSKLTSYGMNGIELEWFTDYLFNCKVQFMHDKRLPESKPLFSGVPEGSILGPQLFVMYFSYIALELNQSKITKYPVILSYFSQTKVMIKLTEPYVATWIDYLNGLLKTNY